MTLDASKVTEEQAIRELYKDLMQSHLNRDGHHELIGYQAILGPKHRWIRYKHLSTRYHARYAVIHTWKKATLPVNGLHRVLHQLEYVVTALQTYPKTHTALAWGADPVERGKAHMSSLVYLNFILRYNEVHCFVHFRECNASDGLPFILPILSIAHEAVAKCVAFPKGNLTLNFDIIHSRPFNPMSPMYEMADCPRIMSSEEAVNLIRYGVSEDTALGSWLLADPEEEET